MSSDKPSKRSELSSDSLLIAGLEKHLASATAVMINGTSYTGADLVKQVQARVDTVNATIASRATWQAAVKAEQQELAASRPFLQALKKALYAMFTDVDDLADFGLVPHKKPVISPAERVAAAAKAKATRAARHTMGSKQKAAITGSGSSPVTSPSASPVATAPVASAPVATVAPQAPAPAAPAVVAAPSGSGPSHA